MTNGPVRAQLAEGYAARGWAVFPCQVNGKQPATRSGLYAGTDDLVTVRRWWRNTDYNIGIWTGASGLVVIDLDLDKDAPRDHRLSTGLVWWLETCKQHDTEPFDTYCVVTMSDGMHVYFTVPPDADIRPSAKQLHDFVDVRGGPSYVIAAGSEVDGNGWYHDGPPEPAECPLWLLNMIVYREPLPEHREKRQHATARFATTHFEQFVLTACADIQSAHPGIRNETLNWCAFRVFRFSLPEQRDYVRGMLEAAGVQAGLKEREVRDTLRSAERAADRYWT